MNRYLDVISLLDVIFFFLPLTVTGAGSSLAAALAGMKEARIVLTRLDIVRIYFLVN